MGSNSTQAVAVGVFLMAWTCIAAGIANSNLLLDLVGLAALIASLGLFRKCKPWETAGE